MTDSEIRDLWIEHVNTDPALHYWPEVLKFARAVEAARATPADHISPEPFGYVYRIISEMRPHDPMYRFAKTGELNPDPEVVKSWTKHAVYLTSQISRSRDSVIEECAKKIESLGDSWVPWDYAAEIRALKSQRSGNGESS